MKSRLLLATALLSSFFSVPAQADVIDFLPEMYNIVQMGPVHTGQTGTIGNLFYEPGSIYNSVTQMIGVLPGHSQIEFHYFLNGLQPVNMVTAGANQFIGFTDYISHYDTQGGQQDFILTGFPPVSTPANGLVPFSTFASLDHVNALTRFTNPTNDVIYFLSELDFSTAASDGGSATYAVTGLSAVPLPGTVKVMVLGLFAMAAFARRKLAA